MSVEGEEVTALRLELAQGREGRIVAPVDRGLAARPLEVRADPRETAPLAHRIERLENIEQSVRPPDRVLGHEEARTARLPRPPQP
jgi:hypothetical protein